MVDETPWVRSMLAVLDEYHRCCVAVVDRESAWTWELYQEEMRETGRLRLSADPGRNGNKVKELTKRHFRQVATMLADLYRGDGYELLAIGGLWAGSVAAVGQLMVQDGAVVSGVICDHDRWLALASQRCPLCGRPVRRAADIVDELMEVVIDEGGSIEHICADTALKEYVAAASLRFPLPPEPNE